MKSFLKNRISFVFQTGLDVVFIIFENFLCESEIYFIRMCRFFPFFSQNHRFFKKKKDKFYTG
ncbi:MAG: hypothetical protein DRP86_02305 [Candidatus Neomarinimicrobiota bacterium]|nr:MAG: hypothetical protein DRP86_02305 [Candidatus Neomarinimicrobiota bacterium]